MQSIIAYFSSLTPIIIIGQIFGVLAIVSAMVMPQFKRKLTMNIFYFLCNVFSLLNVLCLAGLNSASYLFFVVFIQIFLSIYHDSKGSKPSTVENIVFALLYLAAGLFGFISNYLENGTTMSFWYICLQFVPILGAEFAMLIVATTKPQNARIYQVCNCALWAIYYCCIASTLFIGQIIIIVSCIVGIIRHKQN